MIDEYGKPGKFDKDDLGEFGFAGVVLVDCDDELEKVHHETLKRLVELPFPAAVMTRKELMALLDEVDTIPDLEYYLHDRADFVVEAFRTQPQLFLNLNDGLERHLIAYYKMNNYTFPSVQDFLAHASTHSQVYRTTFAERIAARNRENADSYVVDKFVDLLQEIGDDESDTRLHAWELASMTRRQRVELGRKISNAMARMAAGNKIRHFAYYHPATGCWLVFLFEFGSSRDEFRERANELTRQKLFFEMTERDFQFSVFGFAIRKSFVDTGRDFDDVILTIEDAENYPSIPEEELEKARTNFSLGRTYKITEFP